MKKLAPLFLLLLIASCSNETLDEQTSAPTGLTFIHLNDTYRVGDVEDGTRGGFGRVATIVRQLQAQGRDVRILHAGDFLFPSLESQLWNGEQMIEALNYLDDLAPMYLVPGNHEFDPRNSDHLKSVVPASRFDWIGDNYNLTTGDAAVDGALNSGFTIEYEDRKIGIFGLMMHADDGGNERDYVSIEKDYVAAAKRSIENFEQAGADIIVGITHLHMWSDREIAALRAGHPGFMFVVGGHEHEPEYSGLREDSAAIMKGASNGRAIWQIDVDFGVAGTPSITTNVLPMDINVAIDPGYAVIQAKWRDRLNETFPFLSARVGEAAIPLDAREMVVRNQETSWANFIVDQMRTAFGGAPADLAFINSGTLRIDDIIMDDIRFEDIGRTFGFSSYLRYMQMSGAEFRQVMEAGYRGKGPSQGYFPAISGFRICVDRKLPDFHRIVSLQVPSDQGWAEIETERLYDVVVPDYLYRGGDGYEIPQDRPVSKRGSELKYLVLDAILRAQAEGRAIGEAIDPNKPRYVELGASRSQCWM